MAIRLKKCPKCGKLHASKVKTHLCERCLTGKVRAVEMIEDAIKDMGMSDVADIAAFAGVTEEQALRIIHERSLMTGDFATRPPCKHCGKQPALPGSRYCLECRGALDEAFGSAAMDVVTRIYQDWRRYGVPSASDAGVSVVRSLQEKRSRTTSARGYSPRNHWSA